MIDSDRFLEYAEVFGNYYGTSMTGVNASLANGTDVILEIDWQGAAQVRQKLADVISIFILPPSRNTLIERLKGRGQDSDDVIEKRTAEAVLEMRQYHRADYLIINDDFDQPWPSSKPSFSATGYSNPVRHCAMRGLSPA